MPIPHLHTFYMITGSAPGSNGAYELRETTPPHLFTAYGWIQNSAPPSFQRMDFQTETARTAIQATPYTTLSTGANVGDFMRTERFTAIYSGDPIQITMSLKGATANGTLRGFLVYRFWRTDSPVGTGAELVSPTFFSSSQGGISTASSSVFSASLTLPPFRLDAEYLFVQTQFAATRAGGANTVDADMYQGPTSQSVVKMVLMDTYQSGIIFSHDEYPGP